ncbi:hypothetical protein X735_30945 [Mesorhizobium sp. L2C085B000]|nr:hypothetical protein X735_30945 [Mesorhizobium sp. L2C085B000]
MVSIGGINLTVSKALSRLARKAQPWSPTLR